MRLVGRGLWVVWTVVVVLLAQGWGRLRAPRQDASERERARGRALAGLLERLGATYVKLGQILGSRPDLLGPGYIEALARLHDAVAAIEFAAVERVLIEELGEARDGLVELEPAPLAAASVAQVHRGRLRDGREVAVKVQRPEAAMQIERDLSLMSLGARLLDLVPSVRLLSLPGTVAEFGEALRGQLDFRAEADNNRRFARNFADVEEVRVPELVPELCTRRVLCMELIRGVKSSQPEKVDGDRAALARIGAEAVLKMIFEDGFVHADLHPGNVMLTDDDRVVLLDLGMVAEVPAEMVRPWVETNLALAQQNGQEAARLFYVYAPEVGTRDYASYERDVVAYFEGLYGKSLGDVEVSEAVGGIMNILRRHRVQVDPAFTVVNVAMLVAEGLGKQLDPSIDMVALGKPHLMRALASAPPGKPPLREPPLRTALARP